MIKTFLAIRLRSVAALTCAGLSIVLWGAGVATAAPAGGRAATTAPAGQVAAPSVPGLHISPHLSLDPPQGLLIDAWYHLELLDKPVGYMRTAMRRTGDHIETLDYTLIQIARGPVTIKIVLRNLTVETLAGEPVEMVTEQVFANQPMKYHAIWQADGSIELQVTQGGNTITRNFEADPTADMPWSLQREVLSGKRKAGDSFSERSYAFISDTRPMKVEHEAVGPVRAELPGGRVVPAYRYRIATGGMGAGETDVDLATLVPLRFEMPVMGMKFKAALSPREQVQAQSSQPAAELFFSTLVTAKVVGGIDPAQAEAVRYTMVLTGQDKQVDMLNTAMQRVVLRRDDRIDLLVSRWDAPRKRDDRAGKAPREADLDKYLAATAYANIDDEVIRKMADEAAGGEADPLQLAERLTRYVYKNIEHKGLDVAFATASEVARTRQGDCTEHAALLAALARAKGLPARGAFGMVAMPGSYADGEMTFGYHMWTQIYVGGRWLDFDAALNQPHPDATHILLGISDLADTSISVDSVKTFMQLAGNMDLTARASR